MWVCIVGGEDCKGAAERLGMYTKHCTLAHPIRSSFENYNNGQQLTLKHGDNDGILVVRNRGGHDTHTHTPFGMWGSP